MSDYVDLFVKHLLEECKYPAEDIIRNIYRYDGKSYGRVEVLDGGFIIQAFVLMDKGTFPTSGSFPFHRTYTQRNIYGYLMPPACNVASCDENGKWRIYSASNLRSEITRTGFLSYKEAVKRFEKRLEYFGHAELAKKIKCRAICSVIAILLYAAAHILSINGMFGETVIPLNSTILTAFVVIIVLLLLPPLIPYLRNVAIGNVGLNLTEPGPKQ